MTNTTNVKQLKLNIMTQAQYDTITPSPSELYMITDAEVVHVDDAISSTSENPVQNKVIYTALNGKQDTLVSGTNIKTVNNSSLLGSGNITIDSLPSQSGQSGKFLTTNGTAASWGAITVPTKISDLTDDTSTYPIDKADTLTGLTATVAELNYTDGVTSNIQTQLNGKQATLVSGANIKTVNSTTLLGSGNISVQPTIDSNNKLSSDLVDDTNHTHKFATSAQLTQIGTNQTDISTINGKIPSQASTSNQLADKAFVNSSVQTATANFRGNWDTWALVPTSASSYPTDYAGSTTPTVNDYMVVQDASDYTGDTLEGTWRFKYTGTWSTDGKSGWNPEYQVNETPLTSAQLAALNSGITSSDVTLIGTALQPNDNISELTNDAGYITGISSSDVTTALGYTPYNATNPNGYISGITSSDVTTALGYTPYNSTNPNGYISGITSSDVTSALGYTPYNSTNPNGYITGISSSDVTSALGYTPYNSTNPDGYITSSDLTNYVTTNTDQDITGTKTFVGTKKVAFKQSGTSDKLGFTLYNNSGTEKGYLEFNPTNTIDGAPLMTLGNYATSAAGITQVGFRRYSNVSGASGAYNLLTPLIADAKTPFSLTTTYTNFYLPLGFTDGSALVKADKSGLVDISSLLPDVSNFVTNSSLATTLSSYATQSWVGQQGYITGITSSDVTTALGYTPYNSTNPNGYISSASLSTLTDVVLSSPTQGQNLTYDATLGKWKNTSTTATVAWGGITGTLADQTDLTNALSGKQATLVSGTNIKTINNTSLLGSGNITVDSLPSQSGQSGKFLTTNGTTASWSNVSIPTVDQTFDGTSTNAQSGVAIAGELVNYVPTSYGNIGFDYDGTTISGGSHWRYHDTTEDYGIEIDTEGHIFISYKYNSNETAGIGLSSNYIGLLADSITVGNYNNSVGLTVSNSNKLLVDNEPIATEDWVTDQEYATETWVGQQGYITGITSSDVTTALGYTPQTQLISGTNIKTVNNTSLLGSGNIDVLANTATGTNSLTISGTATTATSAINIGATSTAGGGYSVALGYYAASNGARSTSIGYGARIGASTADAIQIGNGTNSTAKSLSVGFYNTANYILLDGTTGYVPSDRINAVKDQNSGSAKTWTGTLAQYNAISTKDSNTLYYITDD